MTVSEAIITWLMTYDEAVESIDTDIISASTASYALSKEPVINAKHYLSGKVENTAYYQFTARLDSQTNADRRENNKWLENLEKWVLEQRNNNNLPIVTDADVMDVYISSSYYMGQTAEDNSLYSLTIGIKYTI